MCYAQLLHAKMREDPEVWRFYQGVNERITDIASDLRFFTLELNLIEPDAMEAKLKAPALARYASWVRDTRAFRPHQLAEDMERLLNDQHVAGRSAWVRLFDETMDALRFPYRARRLPNAEALNLLSDTHPARRRAAGPPPAARLNATARECTP